MHQPNSNLVINMKSILLKYIFIISLFCGSVSMLGQAPMSLYYLKNTPQSVLINPAKEPRPNFFIGIPMVNSLASFQSDIPLVDFIQLNSDGIPLSPLNDGYDYSKLYNKIGDGINLRMDQQIIPLMFGFRTRNGYFTFSFSEKVSMNYGLPKGFFVLLENGTPDNTTISLNGLNIENAIYHEFAFSYSRSINDKLTVAARIKPLFGVAASKTDFTDFTIHTSRTSYDLVANADIMTSIPGVEEIEYDEDGVPSDIEMQDVDSDYFLNNALSFTNPGIAFDFGAVYELDDKWSFSAALNDLGAIKWKDNLNSLSARGSYSYQGALIDTSVIDNGSKISEDIVDSLLAGVNITHDPLSFRTGLSPVLYMGAEYNVNHVFSLGFLSRSIFHKDFFRQDFNVSANLNLYHRLATSVNYNVDIRGKSHVGFGLSSFIGPLQIYMMVDKIPLYYRNYTIDGNDIPIFGDMQSASVMFGMNLVFGSKGFKDKPMLSLRDR